MKTNDTLHRDANSPPSGLTKPERFSKNPHAGRGPSSAATAFLLATVLVLAIPFQATAAPSALIINPLDTAERVVQQGVCIEKPRTPTGLEFHFGPTLNFLNDASANVVRPRVPTSVCVRTCSWVPDAVAECDDFGQTCPSGEGGVEPVCVRWPQTCPNGEIGLEPRCHDLPKPCDGGRFGLEPACVSPPPPPGQCPPGRYGVPPACVAPPPPPSECPSGYVGVPPACVDTTPAGCPPGKVGAPPACATPPPPPGQCPAGWVGAVPACINPPARCPSSFTGYQPLCVGQLVGGSCPIGTMGSPPACVVASSQNGAVTVGVGGRAAAGGGARPDMDSLAVDMAAADGLCDGIPILSMACSASIVAKVSMCIEVAGMAGGFVPINGKACMDAGGGASALATGSLLTELRLGDALAVGHTKHVHPENRQCQRDPYYGEIVTCTYEYKNHDHQDIDKDHFQAQDIYADRVVYGIQNAPLNTMEYMPGWRARDGGAAAFVSGVFDCIDATTNGYTEADNYNMDSAMHLPSCRGAGQRSNAQNVVASVQDSAVLLSEAESMPLFGLPSNETVGQVIMPLSNLTFEDQERVRHAARLRYSELVNGTISAAFESARSGDEVRDAMLWRAMAGAGRLSLAKMEETIAGDFLVSLE